MWASMRSLWTGQEAPVETPVAGAPAEDLTINAFEEETLDELGEGDAAEREEAEE